MSDPCHIVLWPYSYFHLTRYCPQPCLRLPEGLRDKVTNKAHRAEILKIFLADKDIDAAATVFMERYNTQQNIMRNRTTYQVTRILIGW